QSAIDFLGARRWPSTSRIKQSRPLDLVLGCNRLETKQVRKDRYTIVSRVQSICVPDLRVTISVRGISEFERDERLIARPIVATVASHDQVGELSTDQRRQKLPQHHSLIVPDQLTSGGLEHVGLRLSGCPRAIDERVMRTCEGEVHLRHD